MIFYFNKENREKIAKTKLHALVYTELGYFVSNS